MSLKLFKKLYIFPTFRKGHTFFNKLLYIWIGSTAQECVFYIFMNYDHIHRIHKYDSRIHNIY